LFIISKSISEYSKNYAILDYKIGWKKKLALNGSDTQEENSSSLCEDIDSNL